jgi:hypothetical protein
MASPKPWKIEYQVSQHRAGSLACKSSCGKGEVPISIEQDTKENAARSGWSGVTELHSMKTNYVKDIVAADETHVVCFGHDYGEYGSISWEDAELIVMAVNAYKLV